MGVLSVVLGATQGACSLVLDTSAQQCNVDADCKNRGFSNAKCESAKHVCVAPLEGSGGSSPDGGDPSDGASDAPVDPIWGCLGHVVWPQPASNMVMVTIPFWDLIGMVPIFDVSLQLCNKLDAACDRPLGPPFQPGADGLLQLRAPAQFDGYGLLKPTTSADAGGHPWITSMLFFNPPLVRDITYSQVPLFTPDNLSLLASVQGNTIDPQLGTVFVGILDCTGKPAAGATWDPSSITEKTKRFFYVDGLPDENAVATDPTGYGGLINAPTGTIRIDARVQATGQRIGSISMTVRASYSSYSFLAPTP
ncbi:MAG TPA: hypothetical protein VF881_15630 [Polyangiaceae bacterium]